MRRHLESAAAMPSRRFRSRPSTARPSTSLGPPAAAWPCSRGPVGCARGSSSQFCLYASSSLRVSQLRPRRVPPGWRRRGSRGC
eukprot:2247096-Alexandrium_andersonii.AAC.1